MVQFEGINLIIFIVDWDSKFPFCKFNWVYKPVFRINLHISGWHNSSCLFGIKNLQSNFQKVAHKHIVHIYKKHISIRNTYRCIYLGNMSANQMDSPHYFCNYFNRSSPNISLSFDKQEVLNGKVYQNSKQHLYSCMPNILEGSLSFPLMMLLRTPMDQVLLRRSHLGRFCHLVWVVYI